MTPNKISLQNKSLLCAKAWWQKWSKTGVDHWLVSLLSLLIFLIPSNLFLVLDDHSGYAGGLRLDYLIPKLYLSDIVAVGFVSLAYVAYAKPKLSRWSRAFIFAWFILLLRQLLQPNNVSSLWFFAELSLVGLVGWTILRLPKRIYSHPYLTWSLASIISLQSLIAIGQFLSQKSLFGYWFLGETDLLHYAGIASQTLAGREFIIPSGTTAHPNILAGILVLGSVVLWQWRTNIPRWLIYTTLTLGFTCLVLLFSASAWISAVLVWGFLLCRKKLNSKQKKLALIGVWSLTVIIPITIELMSLVSTNTSISRRAALEKVSLVMSAKQPIFGSGLNTFVSQLATTNTDRVLERFIQPAHNIPLLILSETGLLGISIIFLFYLWLRKKQYNSDTLILISCAIVPIISLDHYLYTLESGRLAIVILSLMVLRSGWESVSGLRSELGSE